MNYMKNKKLKELAQLALELIDNNLHYQKFNILQIFKLTNI